MLPPLTLRQRGIDIARDLGIEKSAIPRRQATAMTRTALAIQEAEQAEMQRVFDRPTPFTLRALRVQPANVQDLSAVVYFREKSFLSPQHYLEPQISGGTRPLKRFEQRMRRAGVLPPGMFTVPGQGARLDRYGNMSAGQIVQILSQLRTFTEAGYSANPSGSRRSRRSVKKAGTFFAGRPGGGRAPLGVWQKRGNRIVPVLLFVQFAHYRPTFRFYELAERTAVWRFPVEFARAVQESAARRAVALRR